ncbi:MULTISPECIES: FecCD family ABC transporter permease [Streptomyces]|uniref:Iron chelate uptake ABC transporter family permease subunit n=1 Tax=Streptomyces chengmaiensis TaxID=3040919 RepID=A0ABT6HGZ3_9ACTN|nr:MULTISPECIES: iron chelate uptake ABC transporter family permease subunit [Streptomyces]MDH2388027.1 iron chelate uptake ABC transporter family permease subunit [Streptomyces chengmaiensis]WRQ79956.1 iron chelate uptake ABC transporter family permease subunit [Streptomyces sp. MUM 178J]
MSAVSPVCRSRVVTGMVLRTGRGGLSIRVPGRALALTAVLLAALVVVMGITLTTGDYELSVGEVLRAVTGNDSGAADFIVNTLRMPRLLTALCVGAALAVSGAILQSLTANALGSPDIIGFTNGSAVGALVVIIVLHGSMTQIALGALIGGLATALVVFLLMLGRGLQGFRLVVIGIGVSALLLAVNSYLITRATFQEALEAQAWLIGSLGNRGWQHANAILVAVAVLLPPAFVLSRRLSMVEMGDATAVALGVRVTGTRTALLLISVALASFATAVTGPIAFIALAAPQLARRLTRASGPALASSALMGALLLTASDLAAQRVFSPALLPVGTATGTIGGLYLIWLLVTESRKSRA